MVSEYSKNNNKSFTSQMQVNNIKEIRGEYKKMDAVRSAHKPAASLAARAEYSLAYVSEVK